MRWKSEGRPAGGTMVCQEEKTTMRMEKKREEEEISKEITTVTIEQKTTAIVEIVLAIIETAKEILLAIVTIKSLRRIGEIALVLFQSREITNAEKKIETTTDATETETTIAEPEMMVTTKKTNPKTMKEKTETEEIDQSQGKETVMRMVTSLLVEGIEMGEMERGIGLRVDRCV
jgi:lipopolysaccharide export LptBFGC system permease protein LptF